MKALGTILICILGLSLSAHAADKKLGNVIAVERSVEKVYESCTDAIEKDKRHNPKDTYFICNVPVGTTSADLAIGGQKVLTVRSDECTIDAELKDARLIISMNGTGSKANYASAKACLQKAIDDNGGALTFVVYTIE